MATPTRLTELEITDLATFLSHTIFKEDIHLQVDNGSLYIGASDDFHIVHNGTNTHLINSTGNIVLENNALGAGVYLQATTTGGAKVAGVSIAPDAATDLHYAGGFRLGTTTDGARVDGVFFPNADGASDLGKSGARFKDIYATNATIQTSDVNQKDIIGTLDESQSINLIKSMDPIGFTWKDVSDDQVHWGFTAQDFEQNLTDVGLDPDTIAALVSGDTYGMRYNELIAPLVKTVQALLTQQADLLERLEVLEN